MIFPVSGVEVNPIIPFVVAFTVSFFYIHGWCLRCLFTAAVSGQFSGVYRAIGERHQPGVQCRCHSQRGLPVHQGRTHGVAPYLGGYHWYAARGVYRSMGANRVPAQPEKFQVFCGMHPFVYRSAACSGYSEKKRWCRVGKKPAIQKRKIPLWVSITQSSLKRVEFSFDDQSFGYTPSIVLGICFLVGIAGGIYGIGGGSIVAPFFVAILGLPVYAVAGAALMGTFITSVAGVIFLSAFISGLHGNIGIAGLVAWFSAGIWRICRDLPWRPLPEIRSRTDDQTGALHLRNGGGRKVPCGLFSITQLFRIEDARGRLGRMVLPETR